MDKAQRHRFVLLSGDGVLYAGFQYLATINDVPDRGYGTKRGVLFERAPIAVESDQPGSSSGTSFPSMPFMLIDRVLSTSRFSTTVTCSKVSI